MQKKIEKKPIVKNKVELGWSGQSMREALSKVRDENKNIHKIHNRCYSALTMNSNRKKKQLFQSKYINKNINKAFSCEVKKQENIQLPKQTYIHVNFSQYVTPSKEYSILKSNKQSNRKIHNLTKKNQISRNKSYFEILGVIKISSIDLKNRPLQQKEQFKQESQSPVFHKYEQFQIKSKKSQKQQQYEIRINENRINSGRFCRSVHKKCKKNLKNQQFNSTIMKPWEINEFQQV